MLDRKNKHTAKFVPYEYKTSIVQIISYADKQLKGMFVNPYYKDEMRFDNMMQLIALIENMQNDLNYPQKAMEPRSFKDEQDGPTWIVVPKATTDTGKYLASFKLNIMFRQNASWQGSILWVDEQVETQFRSALELFLLMDGVLSEQPE